MASRTTTLATIAGVAIGSLVMGFVVGGQVQSPREAAADALPPEASAVTVPVERRELSSQVVTRGDAVFDGAVELKVELGALETAPVVTGQVPAVGDTIEEGQAILEIVGRPVIALTGDLPTYRSLRPGMRGPDVRQLEAALDRLGLDPGDTDDARYDAATGAAVAALFERAGYEAPQMSSTIEEELGMAEDAVAAAEGARDSARQSVAQLESGVPESQRLAAQADIDAAERALSDARDQQAQHADDLDAAGKEQEAARAQLDQAQRDHDEARQSGDPDRVAATRAARDDARDRVRAAGAHLDELERVDAGAQVAEAETSLAIARARYQEMLTPEGLDAARSALADAQETLADAQSDLAEIRAEIGTPAPAAELVFVPSLPRRVDAVAVERGSLVEAAVMTASGADLLVRATVPPSGGELLTEGMSVDLEGQDVTLGGEVTSIRETDTGYDVVVTPTDLADADAGALRGANLKVTIPVSSTDGQVMVVPLAALTAGPDGGSRVEVAGPDGDTTLVEVEVGLSADGYAEIRPVGSSVSEGDQVVVGL